MDALKELMFIEVVIPNNIGTHNNMWVLLMGSYLHIFNKGIQIQKFEMPQTYYSPIYCYNENLIRCHNVEIHPAENQLVYHDLLEICNKGNGTRLTENHVITNVAWRNNTALVTVNFFISKNDQYDKKDAHNYLFAITGIGGEVICRKLAQHSYLPFTCTQAGSSFWVSFYNGLHIWQKGVEVDHGLTIDKNVAIENIFITEDEKQMIMINALGKALVIDTSTLKMVAETQMQTSRSTLITAMSPDGNLLATGNNDGDCFIYQKIQQGYEQVLKKNMNGIITALNISNRQLLLGINGNIQRGMICYQINV